MKYDEEIIKYLDEAKRLSVINRHEFITCEHLLFTLLKLSSDFRHIFRIYGDGRLTLLENELKNHISEKNQVLTHQTEPIRSVVLDEILRSLEERKNTSKITVIDFLKEVSKDNRTYSKTLLEKHAISLDKIQEEGTTNATLDQYTEDLVRLAKNGKIDPIIGRQFELDRMIQILSRRKKSNPVLLGETGVGKTAIVEGLALAIAEKRVPENLQNARIYAFDMTAANAKSSLKEVIKNITQIPNAILFIDEIHALINDERYGDNSMANYLKLVLSTGSLKCIGATTFIEYRNTLERNKTLEKQFSKINVDEPSKEEALLIIKGLKNKYEAYHKVKFDDETLEASVELSKKVFQDRFLPDAAIDLIDELGASFVFKEHKKEVSVQDLEDTLTKMTHTHKAFEFDKAKMLKDLESTLQKQIFGQDEVIKAICAALRQSYAGLKTSNTPRGVFLFTGSSGVGKTELCKVLAQSLGLHLERFDMSEFFDKHEIAKFIGSPFGYVGSEEGGLLTNAIRSNPYSVVLFDEIEKADPRVTNIFLQIFDHATLTDGMGIKADFKNTIIVMTSNLGLSESAELGFLSKDEAKSDKAIKNFFAPEFINRIDKILHFKDLSDDNLEKIVQKELDQMAKNLKNISIEADKKTKMYLAKKGYKKEFGARFLKRVIAEEVGEKLSNEILFGQLKKGGSVKLKLKNNAIEFVF